ACDDDDDDDGLADGDDNCPAAAKAEQAGTVGDGGGDACDTDADGDGSNTDDEVPDCDDQDKANYPVTYYPDADQDGVGDAGAATVVSCTPQEGYVTVPGDCDPTNPDIHEGAVELCGTLVDEDCDDEVDEPEDCLSLCAWVCSHHVAKSISCAGPPAGLSPEELAQLVLESEAECVNDCEQEANHPECSELMTDLLSCVAAAGDEMFACPPGGGGDLELTPDCGDLDLAHQACTNCHNDTYEPDASWTDRPTVTLDQQVQRSFCADDTEDWFLLEVSDNDGPTGAGETGSTGTPLLIEVWSEASATTFRLQIRTSTDDTVLVDTTEGSTDALVHTTLTLEPGIYHLLVSLPDGPVADVLEYTVAADVCTPSCEGAECGDDGCGGTCGECEADKVCQNGQCVTQYIDTGDGMATAPAHGLTWMSCTMPQASNTADWDTLVSASAAGQTPALCPTGGSYKYCGYGKNNCNGALTEPVQDDGLGELDHVIYEHDAYSACQKARDQLFGGYGDWRVPTMAELQTMVPLDPVFDAPVIQETGFDLGLEAPYSSVYWSS
ncbi:MAG: DUF1566 domain-containing protein, partial [Myxococcota bacterium]|nr:DUF1566 domain-containing protein [Myxococcota bacterium]